MSKICAFLFCLLITLLFLPLTAFDKVVIWGHKLHSHTHSYVHNAFYHAFNHLGYRTYWFDDNDILNNFDFANSLFITEGQVDKKIPLRPDCQYILHNCDLAKYQPYFIAKKVILLGVYKDYVLQIKSARQVAAFIYYDLENKTVYMPWATDLLPNQIEAQKQIVKKEFSGRAKKKKYVPWIGTIGFVGPYFNWSELGPFVKACKQDNVKFIQKELISVEKNKALVQGAYMAPCIVGKYQKEVGYIPCRIFKNISYGQFGITNSLRVYEIFNKKIIYEPDTSRLFTVAKKALKKATLKQLLEQMDFVKTNHTYINRIQTLLDFFKQIEQQ